MYTYIYVYIYIYILDIYISRQSQTVTVTVSASDRDLDRVRYTWCGSSRYSTYIRRLCVCSESVFFLSPVTGKTRSTYGHCRYRSRVIRVEIYRDHDQFY